ncbi:MAG: hypothetical protein WC421_02765 [Elusimicrobiales bacterium]
MADSIALNVAGQEIKNFLAYEVDADMYAAAAAFNVALRNPEIAIDEGETCKLYVNGQLVLNGYVDKPVRATTKTSHSYKLEGRDMMGLLVDRYITRYGDIDDASMKTIAENLLSLVPVIDLKTVSYAPGVFPNQQTLHLRPKFDVGQTVFNTLRAHAARHGLLFYCMPDGSFRFDTPKVSGEAKYNIVFRRDGRGNNVESAEVVRDISKRYSSVVIVSAGMQGKTIAPTPIAKVFTDSSYPKSAVPKPFVIAEDMDENMMAARASMIFAEMRHQSFCAEYRMSGHSHNTRLWTINEICSVDDEVNNLHGNYLITGRTFCLSREHGRTTKVRIGLPGVKVA